MTPYLGVIRNFFQIHAPVVGHIFTSIRQVRSTAGGAKTVSTEEPAAPSPASLMYSQMEGAKWKALSKPSGSAMEAHVKK